jgi:hypothetical protein
MDEMPKNSKEYNNKNYKTYRWTKDRKKYRAWLNKANREAWTYGNGDGMDMSHKDNNPKNFAKKNLKKVKASTNRKAWAAKATRVKKGKVNLFYV